MGRIRELSASLINKIAAGEVVERPASVVKELLENSIDSGATRVELSVERGGKDLIRVADDGCGMEVDDLELAFTPHATSKVSSEEDLYAIRTLGFRGEALAAIAEISRVRCQSRTAQSEVGHELMIEGGLKQEPGIVSGPVGTVIEVRHLFFNTPVRRRFLKTDATEAGHVTEMFTRIALANPTVRMTFRSGSRVIHDLPPVTGMKERIAAFFGRELAENLIWVESELEGIHLWGYVAHPSQSRTSSKGQYLFVSGRYVRDRSLSHALAEAYRGLLMVGRVPICFLMLEIPPDQVDVNVHPTKVEVRFRDGQRIYSQMLAMLRETFLGSDLHAQLQTPKGQAAPAQASPTEPAAHPESAHPNPQVPGHRPDKSEVNAWFASESASTNQRADLRLQQTPSERQERLSSWPTGNPSPSQASPWFEPKPPVFPQVPVSSGPAEAFDEFATQPQIQTPESTPKPEGEPDTSIHSPSSQSGPIEADLKTLVEGLDGNVKAIQLHDSYLVAETSEGMVVIDQHALHERILVEELRDRVNSGHVEGQRLLVPEPVEMTADEVALVIERREELARLGLELEPEGEDGVAVTAVPVMLKKVDPGLILRDLAERLASAPEQQITPDQLLEETINMMACKAAVKANQHLTPEEITELIDRRDLVANSHHCPHGRPTALIFTKAELERQFGRI